jgi:hypothetical protein
MCLYAKLRKTRVVFAPGSRAVPSFVVTMMYLKIQVLCPFVLKAKLDSENVLLL